VKDDDDLIGGWFNAGAI